MIAGKICYFGVDREQQIPPNFVSELFTLLAKLDEFRIGHLHLQFTKKMLPLTHPRIKARIHQVRFERYEFRRPDAAFGSPIGGLYVGAT
jgi:hypothetical protein